MITCTFLKSGDELLGFECKGHAGFARAGRDIVCAGASILTIACANALESVAGVQAELRGGSDGFLEAFLPRRMTDAQSHDAQILMKALHQGLSDLAEAYPTYIRLSIQERRETP